MNKRLSFLFIAIFLLFNLFFISGQVHAAVALAWYSQNGGNSWLDPIEDVSGQGKWKLVKSINYNFCNGDGFVATFDTYEQSKNTNYDKAWKSVASAFSVRSVASDSDGSNLITGSSSGRLYTSSNSGVNWTERQTGGDINKLWTSVASNSTGTRLVAAADGDAIYTSIDGGVNWKKRLPPVITNKYWSAVASDSEGKMLIAAVSGGRIYSLLWNINDLINDTIVWTEVTPAGDVNKLWSSVASDSDGSNLIASVNGGRIYISSNFGVNWTERQPAGNVDKRWTSVASDNTGLKLIASAEDGRIYISINSGVTWAESRPAGDTNKYWSSVASDSDGSNLIATSGDVIYTSINGGANWTERRPAGEYWSSVASDSDGSNLAVASTKLVYTSDNDGTGWVKRQPEELLISNNWLAGADKGQLYIYNNDAYGTWSKLVTGNTTKDWTSVAMSSNGSSLVAGSSERLYTSSDGGATWAERHPISYQDTNLWTSVASDLDGSNLIVSAKNRNVYTSSDGGATWTERLDNEAGMADWSAVASDSDGSNLIASVNSGRIYISSNYGVNWTESRPAGDVNKYWSAVASDSDGSNLIASVKNGRIYTSSDAGATWTEKQPAGDTFQPWSAVATDIDGSKLVATTYGGGIYVSSNSGEDWTKGQAPGETVDKLWSSVASDGDGSNLIAVVDGGVIYTSSNGEVNWTGRTVDSGIEQNTFPNIVKIKIEVIPGDNQSTVDPLIAYTNAKLINNSSSVTIIGSSNVTQCDNCLQDAIINFYYQPLTATACPDGLCIKATTTKNDVGACGDGYVSQDGICIKSNTAICGNKVKEGVEECDGGPGGDGTCTNSCKLYVCGDQVPNRLTACAVPSYPDITTANIFEPWPSPWLDSQLPDNSPYTVNSHLSDYTWNASDNPYSVYSDDSRAQFIIKALELTDLGFKNGSKINALYLKNLERPDAPLKNFTIRIKHTDKATIDNTNAWEGGFATYFGPTDISQFDLLPNDWKRYPLSSTDNPNGFLWNGTSNIMIDISRDDTSSYYSGGGIAVKQINNGNRLYSGSCDNCSLYNVSSGNTSGTAKTFVPAIKLARYVYMAVTCTCPAVCGNNTKEVGEMCDGTDDEACPGLCIPKGQVDSCKCPVCGNGKKEAGEECDGDDNSACGENLCSNAKTEVQIWNDSNGIEGPFYSIYDPYGGNYSEVRTQFIVLKDELINKGFKAGDIISGLSLKTFTKPYINLSNFNIRIKETTLTTLTSWQGGFTNVFPKQTINVSSYASGNWENYDFTTGFTWSGNNNLVIDISDTGIKNGVTYLRHLSLPSNNKRLCLGGCNGCDLSNNSSGDCSTLAYTTYAQYAPSIMLTRKETNNCVCSTPITGSCSVSPETSTVPSTATWTATATGGTGAYTYVWSGMSGIDSLSGTGITTTKTYTTPGIKTGKVKITSGNLTTDWINCSNELNLGTFTLKTPTQTYCGLGAGTGNVAFGWENTSTDAQTGYQIQVASDPSYFDDDGTCTDCEVSDGKTGTATSASFYVVLDTPGDTRVNVLHYSYQANNPTIPKNYYWRLRISTVNHPLINNAEWYYGTGAIKDKAIAVPFQTAINPYPYVYIEPKETPVKFTGGSAITTFYDYDWPTSYKNTTCYRPDGTSYGCDCINPPQTLFDRCLPVPTNLYKWWMTAPLNADPATYTQTHTNPDYYAIPLWETSPSVPHHINYTYTSEGSYKAILKICTGATNNQYCCFGSTNIQIGSPSSTPIWQEISPLE